LTELIKAIVSIKDPLSVMAFFSVVLLLAFRSKAVPDLFFGLLREKLSKERFSQLLHRFMLLGFLTFVGLGAIAVLGQILAYKTRAEPTGLQEFKAELEKIQSSSKQDSQVFQQAIHAYEQGLLHIDRKEFNEAIQSIQDSVNRVQTMSGQSALAYLYKQIGDQAKAADHATLASKIAEDRGDILEIVKANRVSQAVGSEGDHGSLIPPQVAGSSGDHGSLINLTDPENGEALTATDKELAKLIDGKLAEVRIEIPNPTDRENTGATLTIGFKGGKSATIERCAWWIDATYPGNVKDFELSVSNESPTAGFKSIGTFTTQNIRLLKDPFQEFAFSPVRARFVKWKPLTNYGGSPQGNTYGYGLKILGRF